MAKTQILGEPKLGRLVRKCIEAYASGYHDLVPLILCQSLSEREALSYCNTHDERAIVLDMYTQWNEFLEGPNDPVDPSRQRRKTQPDPDTE